MAEEAANVEETVQGEAQQNVQETIEQQAKETRQKSLRLLKQKMMIPILLQMKMVQSKLI